MSDWTEQEVTETLEKVLARTSEDAAFRELAVKDPAKALAETAGRAVPAGVRIRFFDPGDAHLAYVLPPFKGTGELSAEDLDAVAGGTEKRMDGWKCPGCSTINAANKQKCYKCSRPK